MGAWHPRLYSVLGSALLVGILRGLSLDDPGSGPQFAMQVLMPVPIVVGLVTLLPRVKATRVWWLPVVGFLFALPALAYAWTDHGANDTGDESCNAKGFLPIDWTDPVEEGLFVASLVAMGALLAAGLVLTLKWPDKWPGIWSMAAAAVLAVEWLAAPVCVGT